VSPNNPQHDPLPTPRGSIMRRFWRIFRLLLLLSAVVAGAAVILVTRGEGEVHASLIVATAIGVGVTMLLGSSLMALMFLSAEAGHDEAATPQVQDESEEE
jgi:hypothetical protein